MSGELCTNEQAVAALAYLNNSFGGYAITPDESRPYLRLFRNYDPPEVQLAIDTLARTWTQPRRPMPNDIAKAIQAQRPKGKRGDGPYLTEVHEPAPDFSEHMGELRERVTK